jgi:large subunit ribosomal protein L7Ae
LIEINVRRDLIFIIADKLIKLLSKYAPENKKQKKERLVHEAELKNAGKDPKKEGAKPTVLKFGLNHVTTLIEEKKAQLVVIAHDVEPMELVLFIPALCRKMGVPFCFVKGKARLGRLVHQKTATCLALTDVKREDVAELDLLKRNFTAEFNDNKDLLKKWGGGVMGIKNQHMMSARKRLADLELAKKSKV